jgi:hypothetical protein
LKAEIVLFQETLGYWGSGKVKIKLIYFQVTLQGDILLLLNRLFLLSMVTNHILWTDFSLLEVWPRTICKGIRWSLYVSQSPNLEYGVRELHTLFWKRVPSSFCSMFNLPVTGLQSFFTKPKEHSHVIFIVMWEYKNMIVICRCTQKFFF